MVKHVTLSIRPVVVTIAALSFHAGVTALALHNASGTVPVGDGSVTNEFLDYRTLSLALLSLIALVYVAVTSPLWGLALTVGLAAISTWGAYVEVSRWTESGYAQGLEILAYAVPAGILLLGLVSFGLSWLIRALRG